MLVAATSLYACYELYVEDQTTAIHVRTPAECTVDDDCAVLPAAITCCGECDPAPPFEVVTRVVLEARRRDLAASCEPRPPRCDPPSCRSLPRGCEPVATCHDGTCRIVDKGC